MFFCFFFCFLKGGVYVLVSLGLPPNRIPLLTSADLDWDVITTLPLGENYIYVCKKRDLPDAQIQL